ncbi:myomegalin isoform X3 [Engraulis encrasicolus]|uniref:myomegalin isoform X3 n=1 Tax=Engraulis encrasicolus TaxID=184585 RepID=UPI002FD30702
MLDSKQKEACRICARELCGNHRRWIFHPAAKLSLQTLLSHAVGHEVTRGDQDGHRGSGGSASEFACGKCAFVLERMYRFDTVIARVEALSVERMQKLLQEKERLRQGVGAMYWKHNSRPPHTANAEPTNQATDGVKMEALGDSGGGGGGGGGGTLMDISTLTEMSYGALIQEDLAYSVFESWSKQEAGTLDSLSSQHSLFTQQHQHGHGHSHGHGQSQNTRKCRGCVGLRVADSDYEAVCRLPRRLRSTSCGPPTRSPAGTLEEATQPHPQPAPESPAPPTREETGEAAGEELGEGEVEGEGQATPRRMATPSPASSVESLDTLPHDAAPGTTTHPPTQSLEGRDEEVQEEEVMAVEVEERSSSPQEQASSQPNVGLFVSEPDTSGVGGVSDGDGAGGVVSGPDTSVGVVVTGPGPEPGVVYASGLEFALSLVRSLQYRPVQSRRGSRLPVRVKPGGPVGSCVEGLPHRVHYSGLHDFPPPLSPLLLLEGKSSSGRQGEILHELAEMEDLWLDEFTPCRPVHIHERLIDEQQSQLGDYERAASQCVCELQKAQQQVHSLQANIKESEANNMKLQRRLAEMEIELRAVQEVAQCQESTIGTLTDSLATTHTQVSDLQKMNKEQKDMLLSLKSQCQKQQRTKGDALAVEASLFSTQLELQESQRARGHALRQEQDLSRANQRLHDDLQRALKHRQETETHNLDLLSALQRARADLQQMEDATREKDGGREREMEEREKTLKQLRNSLEHKDKLLEDYSDLLDSAGQRGSGERSRESVITKLKQRIQERDRALERAVDEKFVCVEAREVEVRRLQLQLREKERDLDKLRCTCANNQETITSLEALLRGKGLELEQVCEALCGVQTLQRNSEDRHTRGLRERDTLISQLQTSLQTHAKENETLTSSVLSKLCVSPATVVEELKTRLSLKEQLIQDLLRDRSQQAQEHQAQVQDLLSTIGSRDQYIQEAAGRVGEVMSEQTARVQELRRQLVSAQTQESTADTQALQEELRLALRRERDSQQELSSLRASLTGQRNQLQALASHMEAQTQPNQDLDHHGIAMETEQTSQSQAEFADLFSDDVGDDDEEEEEYGSEFAYSVDEEENSKLTAQSLAGMSQGAGGLQLSHDAAVEEVKQLVEQKRAVERELAELRSQLEKSGYSSLSHIRRALSSLQAENQELRALLPGRAQEQRPHDGHQTPEGPPYTSNASTSTGTQLRSAEGKRALRPQSLDLGVLLSHSVQTERRGVGVCESPVEEALRTDLQQVQQHSRDLQERLMVSEATVQAQAEQLKDYRELLTESAVVQQDSKHVQVDLQDLGYETCGRSENEAERDDTSSPEFDDLEMCTALSRHNSLADPTPIWWSGEVTKTTSSSSAYAIAGIVGEHDEEDEDEHEHEHEHEHECERADDDDDVVRLQRLVDDLRGQLERAQMVIGTLQARLRDPSSPAAAATPRKVSWSAAALSGTEEDEGWQSSSDAGGGGQAGHDRELRDLVCRVTSLEEQLRSKGKGHEDAAKAVSSPGRFDSLIQAQARELCVLRGRTREAGGVCQLLLQHLTETTKAFEELLRANDVDYYMGQTFREQLSQSSSLAMRLTATISGRDATDLPDDNDKTELLAIRLSKELQQKDKLIETLRSKLEQSRPDTPVSSHALSEGTDQSDRISFVSDEPGSTNEDLELGSDVDTPSEFCHEGGSTTGPLSHRELSRHPSVSASISSSHHSSRSCPSMHCTPQRPADHQPFTGLFAGMGLSPEHPTTSSSTSALAAPLFLPCTPPSQPQPHPHPLSQPQPPLLARPRGFPDTSRGCFSLAEVQQELHTLQRQFATSERAGLMGSALKPHPAFPLATPPSHPNQFLPMSHHALLQSPLSSAMNGSPGTSLLESSALWDMAYGPRAGRGGQHGDLSSGSSGYQSGTSHAGTELMEEHLREIRCLRRRLEDSIQTNDRLRQQLEERLASTAREGGVAPTNIYIQGLDSVSQLSGQIRQLQEENLALQARLDQASREGRREAELLRESLASGRSRLKEAEMEMERWAEQCKRLQTQAREHAQTIQQLTEDKQERQDHASRLQHEVDVLQQQLRESHLLVVSLQKQIQSYQAAQATTPPTSTTEEGPYGSRPRGGSAVEGPYGGHYGLGELQHQDMGSLHAQLEQQLQQQTQHAQPTARKQLFQDSTSSPPVRDIGPLSPASSPAKRQAAANGHGKMHTEKHPASPASGNPGGSMASPEGQHVAGRLEDYTSLLQQLLEGKVLISKMEATLKSSGQQKLQQGSMKSLLSSTRTLKRILEEAGSLLRGFWKATLPSEFSCQQSTKDEEITELKLKLQDQEQALKDALENLRASNQTRESMENFITGQLSRTRDVLKKARSNLEVKSQAPPVSGATLLVGVS